MQHIVVGAKSFNDTVEGTLYNTTKLMVLLPQKFVESATQNASGMDVIQIQLNDSSDYKKYNLGAIEYPCNAELDIEMTTKGYLAKSFKLVSKATLVKP